MRIRGGIKMKNNLITLWHSMSSQIGIGVFIAIAALTTMFYFAFGIWAGIAMFVVGYIIGLILITSFEKYDEN
jgi:membrane protein YdbS with pleckstrin-like domain